MAEATAKRPDVIWIEEMVDKKTVIELYSQAAVFCCPSIYEPFGIINLEAMACETAVVASAVGGIKEVVVDGETGFLVPLEQMKESPFEPIDPEKFERDLAARINQLMADPSSCAKNSETPDANARKKNSAGPRSRKKRVQLLSVRFSRGHPERGEAARNVCRSNQNFSAGGQRRAWLCEFSTREIRSERWAGWRGWRARRRCRFQSGSAYGQFIGAFLRTDREGEEWRSRAGKENAWSFRAAKNRQGPCRHGYLSRGSNAGQRASRSPIWCSLTRNSFCARAARAAKATCISRVRVTVRRVNTPRAKRANTAIFCSSCAPLPTPDLVGYPNAGKSTLLRKLSAARPKVAPYPFTTLHPIVGVVELDAYHRATIADIPGLIEGAHRNVGLGHDFLRHITRCKVLLFVVDTAGSEGRHPIEDLQNLRREIDLFDPRLSQRPWYIIANKMDLARSGGKV